MPTINSLLIAAKEAAWKRFELLFLLALLSGVLTSILYRPAVKLINQSLAVLDGPNLTSVDINAATTILSNGISTLVLGQLAVIAITAFLLPPWVRATLSKTATPGAGGAPAFFKRGLVAFGHMLTATGLTIVSIIIIAPIALGLGKLLGSLGSFLIFSSAILLFWLNIVWSAIANIAIASSTDEQPYPFKKAWAMGKLFLRPIGGSLAFIWFIALVLNLLLTNMVTQSLPASLAETFSLLISGSLTYLTCALHIGALSALPGLVTALNSQE